MTLEKKPFVRYNDNNNLNSEVVSLKLNKEERSILDEAKRVLNQSKDGTAIKMLMKLAHKRITLPENLYLIETIFRNKRLNERTGIADFN